MTNLSIKFCCVSLEQLAMEAPFSPELSKTKAAESEEKLKICWPILIYMVVCHLLAVCCVVKMFVGQRPMMITYLWTIVLWFISGLGITAGAHRLWSHRSYKAGKVMRGILMIFTSIANQGTVLKWVRDHRVHHLYSDTPADPHNSQRGFFFSHVGWLLTQTPEKVSECLKKVTTNDLMNDGFLTLQSVPYGVCIDFWGESLMNAFLLAGAFRYCFVLHATWAVNSVVHRWGVRPYDQSAFTTENPFVAFFALGEGWHNWHHAFEWDYATSEMGVWQQYNPTKAFIDFMCWLGLAWGRRRANPKGWDHMKERLSRKLGPSYKIVEVKRGVPLFRYRETKLVKES
ncbi:Acyl-CoA desaturase, putative [Perkinsus marinus ATCC 50983]|uniref:Acyl-CoA desaturase, putative n=1 Tax=Perkinsus marinus (strain ATCC 50983 / TXsc) TaxID=423536 RepID=C5KIV9_PERM5|nr:Acyl-CoA desaturase, putative [Perkinsus marinus ATCC 50983]EER15595.1 Acyl-CoA desaturase, putative [Perkinsus marinus ATCC 50983]|eukprot:XP_002783799.1 Acyl-CoA desaturase, putative [Perkinsus marinus ATCC 50983]